MSSYKEVSHVDELSHKSILLGRGPTRYQHSGNRAFRDLVKPFVTFYSLEACNNGKKMITRDIYLFLLKVGYRFLYQAEAKSGDWIECTTDMALRKIQHTLRDMRTHVIRKDKVGDSHHHSNSMLRQCSQEENLMGLTCQSTEEFSILKFNQITNLTEPGDSGQGKHLRLLEKVNDQGYLAQKFPYKEQSIHVKKRLNWESPEDSSFLHKAFRSHHVSNSYPFHYPLDDQSHKMPSFMKRDMSCDSLQALLDECFEEDF
jgi:hypothetical protein